MRRLRLLLTLAGLLVPTLAAFGQGYPTDPVDFYEAIQKELSDYKYPRAEQFSERLEAGWNEGNLSDAEKRRAIKQINDLKEKGWKLFPDLVQYMETLLTLKSSAVKIRISSGNFFEITDSCAAHFPLGKTGAYLQWLEQFAPQGRVYQTAGFAWALPDPTPRLEFLETELDGKFPAIQYSNTKIMYVMGEDSNYVKDADGYLNIFTRRFHGSEGKYDWTRVGLSSTAAYCTFKAFDLDLTSQRFRIDTVEFYYPEKVDGSLTGSLNEYLVHYEKPEQAMFPYFRSYEGDLVVERFVPNVRYEGGLSLRGVTIFGTRTRTRPATLFIKNRHGETVLKVETSQVALNPYKMAADSCNITLYLAGKDTISHPSMYLFYKVETQDITLSINRQEREAMQPIQNSYHNYNMYFDAIKWNPNSDTMAFTAIVDKEHKLFAIESYDFFQYGRFHAFQGVLFFNPIALIYHYYRKINLDRLAGRETPDGSGEFGGGGYDDEYGWDYYTSVGDDDGFYDESSGSEEGESAASETEEAGTSEATAETDEFIPIETINIKEMLKWAKSENQARQFDRTLDKLEGAGFIRVGPARETLEVTNLLRRWGAAAAGRKDYDAILITSQVDFGPNALMSYETKELELLGVSPFTVSDSHFVEFSPQEDKIFVGQNRDFRCGGTLRAGKVNMKGEGFERFMFDYEDFNVLCDSVSYMSFSPKRDPLYAEKAKQKDYRRLADGISKLKIHGLTGTLYIDKPYARSGLKTRARYPIFDSHSPSYVYWDSPSVQGGVYTGDRLYFVQDPFMIDSLGTFDLAGLEFYGEFMSGGVAPNFRDTLKLAADYTYGVTEVLPDTGTSLYGGKAKFYNKLTMDQFGLHGDGEIQWRSATCLSDTFIFHFDSVMAVTDSFYLPPGEFEGVNYPEVKVKEAAFKWRVEENAIELTAIDEPILMYGGSAEIYGTVRISPTGVSATGMVEMGQEIFSGKLEHVNPTTVALKDGTYRVRDATDSKKIHFRGRNINAERDMQNQITTFHTTTPGKANMAFPSQNYVSTLDRGTYHRTLQEIKLDKTDSLPNPYFQSSDSAQHGLKFVGRAADYSLTNESLEIDNVDSIFVADAIAYPSGSVFIREGKVQPIRGSRLLANVDNRRHEFLDAEINIESGIKYTGAGVYKYIPIDSVNQVIFFDEIYSGEDTVTRARAMIDESAGFFITERFYFKDTIELIADQAHLDFKGGVRIKSSLDLGDNWISVNIPNADPDSIVVKIDESNIGKGAIGVFAMSDRHGYYSRFLNSKLLRRDKPVFQTEGAITFDRKSKEFRIGPLGKLKGRQLQGNTISFYDTEDSVQIITSEGRFDFPVHYGARSDEKARAFTMDLIGEWRQNQTRETVKTDMLMLLDFPDEVKSAFQYYGESSRQMTFDAGDMNIHNPKLHSRVSEAIEPDNPEEPKTKELLEILKMDPAPSVFDMADRLKDYDLALHGVKFVFCDSSTRRGEGFFYAEKPVGVIGVGGESVNKISKAKILYTVGVRNPNGTFQDDKLQIYLEPSDGEWLFIEAKDNELKVGSSNLVFNREMAEVAKKLGKKAARSDKTSFVVRVVADDYVNDFLRDFSPFLLSGCGK